MHDCPRYGGQGGVGPIVDCMKALFWYWRVGTVLWYFEVNTV